MSQAKDLGLIFWPDFPIFVKKMPFFGWGYKQFQEQFVLGAKNPCRSFINNYKQFYS
jgi:hypothetical protein